MNSLFKRTALWLLMLFVSSHSQVAQNGSIQFISNPSKISIFSPQHGLIGQTPCLFKIPYAIPAQAWQTGVWQLGPFKAYSTDGSPIIFYPKLTLTESIKNQYTSQKGIDYCWTFTVPVADETQLSSKDKTIHIPTFFACNHWVDENQDGAVETDEWIGIKDRFRPNETITFVAYIDKGVGAEFRYELRTPNNIVPILEFDANPKTPTSIKTETTNYNKSVIRVEFSVRDLLSSIEPTVTGPTRISPAGDWKMYWYIEGTLVNITEVSLK